MKEEEDRQSGESRSIIFYWVINLWYGYNSLKYQIWTGVIFYLGHFLINMIDMIQSYHAFLVTPHLSDLLQFHFPNRLFSPFCLPHSLLVANWSAWASYVYIHIVGLQFSQLAPVIHLQRCCLVKVPLTVGSILDATHDDVFSFWKALPASQYFSALSVNKRQLRV